MSVSDLPAVNATLNAIASVFLVIGWVLIRQGRREQHRLAMLAAFGTSTLFLVGYVISLQHRLPPLPGPHHARLFRH
jgi:uncharacterized membrane protein YozB (DUF420 family)